MPNAEGMTKPETRKDRALWSFVIRSLFRHSSFVICHSAAAALLSATTAVAVEPLEESVEQKYDLDANATLSVANTDGSIRVYAHDLPGIIIRAFKKAYTEERLRELYKFFETTSALYVQVRRWPTAAMFKLMKTGDKVLKVLGLGA